MRLARLEGEAKRLARAEQVLLADDFVERLRAQRIGERRRRLRSSEKIVHRSPRTSAPFGGSKRNSAGSIFALRTTSEKRSTVVCPK